MSEVRDREIRALKDLLASDGWAILEEKAYRQQWQGEALCGRIRSIVKPQQGERATECAKEVLAGRDAIDDFVVWPKARLKKLEADAAAEAASSATDDIVRRA
jgi:hypothetical protein